MAQDWQVEQATGVCSVSGRRLEEGDEFYTVLFEDGETFKRLDYSVGAWTGPPDGCFCYFKSRVPVKEKRKKLLVDNELLVSFFQRLADETEPARVHFRFVLALILMRKRLLRYEDSGTRDGAEVWRMMLVSDHSIHQVVNPQLTDDQIDDVGRQLGAILHSDMGEWGTEDSGDQEAAPARDEGQDETS